MKKGVKIAKNILVWLIVAIAVFMIIFTVVSVSVFDRKDKDLFGYQAYIVNTDSMAATDFKAGDLVIAKWVEPSTLKEGDIITFSSQDPASFGEIITHKIRRLTTTETGEPAFVTYGTTTDVDDIQAVTYPFILGKYQTHLSGVGTFFHFLKTPQGYIICIFVPFMLLILYQGLNCIRLFRRYKKEQLEAMESERLKIEAERAESQKMMEELMALKAQLAQNAPPAAPAEEAAKEQGEPSEEQKETPAEKIQAEEKDDE